jgi:DTW domain-containing protein YfiP
MQRWSPMEVHERQFRKRKTIDPCEGCCLHIDRCICHLIPSLDLKTKLTLVVHYRELKRTTSTGRLAVKALVNSELLIRGIQDSPLDLSQVVNDQYESYVLYPSDDAIDIESLKPEKPVQLIVADGNWRQAGKLHRRHEELKDIPRVCIKVKNTATESLRREHFDAGYSTLEAIALAIGVLEGNEVRRELQELYQHKLKATLQGRGRACSPGASFLDGK